MDVLDSARKRKSAFAAQLADQDAAMAQLQAKLEAARVEGERLKARAEAPEAPAAAAAHAEGTSVAVVVSETPVVEAAAPSRPRDAAPVPTAETTAPVTPPRPPPPPEEETPTTADLLALAATTNPLDESNGERCAACGDDAYSLRSQLALHVVRARLPRGLREIKGHPLPRVDARGPAVPRALREALFWGLDVPGVRAAAGRRLRAACFGSFMCVVRRADGARGGAGEG